MRIFTILLNHSTTHQNNKEGEGEEGESAKNDSNACV